MVDPLVSPVPGGLSRALLARKGEAIPAAPTVSLPAERVAVGVRRAPDADERQRTGKDSPLAFLIARRSGAAVSAAGDGIRRHPAAPANDQYQYIEGAAAPRRPLTVRLRHEDFLRLRALTEARATTYQSLIEAGILGMLTADGAAALPTTAAMVAEAAAPSAKRRRFGR